MDCHSLAPPKVKLINNRKSPIQDDYIEEYLAHEDLKLTATFDAEAAYKEEAFVVIAASTNYDPKKSFFDTSAVENVIDLVILLKTIRMRSWGLSPEFRWDIRPLFERNTTVIISFSARSSCVNILALQYRDSRKLSTDVPDVDTGIDWLVYLARYSQQCQAQSHFVVRSKLDIVENAEIMTGPIKHFCGTLRPDCSPFRTGIFIQDSPVSFARDSDQR